ncbi:hypothetical protein [Geodermatophilus sp. CPCC 206100]|uniref:hypothetical protein n=1 Tax=Geodermatophilus sp. CPCC 206100 TaxID=3020054 RepID=UPI003B00EF5D
MPDGGSGGAAVLVGNNLAVLVAAVELAEAGRRVVLLTDGRPPGGHFRGLSPDGVDVDLGMVLLETAAPVEGEPDLAGYRPRVRYDWARFGALVDRWLHAHADLVRTPTPEVLVGGRRAPDHLVADRLDVVPALGLPPPAPLPRTDPRHAAGKTTSPDYDTLTYAAAAELNHGPAIQRRLVEPFGRKLLGAGYDTLLARYHRAGWLPLYWPETLAAACAGAPTGLAEHPFWTTRSGFVGDVVRTLERRLAASPHATVDDAPVESLTPAGRRWDVRTRAGGHWSTDRPVLGLAHERLQDLLGLPPRERPPGATVVAVATLVRADAARAPVGCLSVVDPDWLTYRVTDQDALAGRDPRWHRVVVEAGPGAAARAEAGEDVAALLGTELSRLLELPGDDAGAPVRVLRTLTARGAVPVPTAASLAEDDAASDALAGACPQALLTGALLAAGATSMNDQVVQGLAVAARLG